MVTRSAPEPTQNEFRDRDFTGAILERVSLRAATLSTVGFIGARMRTVDFSGADIRGAMVKGTRVRGSELVDVTIDAEIRNVAPPQLRHRRLGGPDDPGRPFSLAPARPALG